MPDPLRMPRGTVPVGRRGLLIGAFGAGLLTLSGCAIRLQDNAPDVPLLPRRSPIPAEQALLTLLADTRELADLCGRWSLRAGASLGPALAGVHRAQVDVLAAILRAADVPAAAVDGATTAPSATAAPAGTASGSSMPTTSSAHPSPSPHTSPPVTAAAVADGERRALTRIPDLAQAAPAMRAAVAALLAQRYAAVRLTVGAAGLPVLDEPAGTGPGRSPTTSSPATPGTPTGSAAAWPAADIAGLLEATRSATYGFQVVTAQGDKAGRTAGLAALADLQAIAVQQRARVTGSPPPSVIGYELPFPVTTPAAARRLGATLSAALLTAYGSQLPSLAESGDVAFTDLVTWLGRAETVARAWGVPLAPFPGMT